MSDTYHQLYDILQRWMHATDEEVTFVKALLMPDDITDTITFRVTDHPGIREDGTIYIEWFDIDIYDREKCTAIGSIILWTSDGSIEYHFD